MTRLQQRIEEALLRHLGSSEARPWIERLLLEGLVDLQQAEQLAIRQGFEEGVRRGEGRCQAMVNLSEEFNCSYEKIRKIIYQKV